MSLSRFKGLISLSICSTCLSLSIIIFYRNTEHFTAPIRKRVLTNTDIEFLYDGIQPSFTHFIILRLILLTNINTYLTISMRNKQNLHLEIRLDYRSKKHSCSLRQLCKINLWFDNKSVLSLCSNWPPCLFYVCLKETNKKTP